MGALKNIMIFWMGSSYWCCSSRCEKCIVFFWPGNFWLWFSRIEMRTSVFSCILWRWENSSIRHALSLPPAGQVHASKHPVHKLLPASFFVVCHFAKSLNSVTSCCGREHLPFRCDLIFSVRLVNFLGWEKTKCDWGEPWNQQGAMPWNGNRTG